MATDDMNARIRLGFYVLVILAICLVLITWARAAG